VPGGAGPAERLLSTAEFFIVWLTFSANIDHKAETESVVRQSGEWMGWTDDQSRIRVAHNHRVIIYSVGCEEIERVLTFRDRLRRNSDDRSRYEQAKRELAAKEWSDMNAYADAKTEVIKSIIAASQAAGEISQ
jgi:GrpB-like predicted nucleotidyltransferase (UPF0157 family)